MEKNILATILKYFEKEPYDIADKIFNKIDPEKIRKAQHWMLKEALIYHTRQKDNPILKTVVWNKIFSNPIGFAAGYDTEGKVSDHLIKLGFGFGEVGTVTNESENILRDVVKIPEELALVNKNRGFNNVDNDVVVQNLASIRSHNRIIGVSIGENYTFPNTTSDPAVRINNYDSLVKIVAPYADFITISFANPNMRNLNEKKDGEFLGDIINAIKKTLAKITPIAQPQILIKIHGDIADKALEFYAEHILSNQIGGVIICGSSKDVSARKELVNKSFGGAISGKPLFERSNEIISKFYNLTDGRVPIIGVGGIFSGKDVYDKMKAGASLVQLYSALIFKGPHIVKNIKQELISILEKEKVKDLKEIIGIDVK